MTLTVVPVLGVSQRSGTHWLADLLAAHPDCRLATTRPGRAGSGWEDLLLEQSPSLLDFAHRARRRWGEGFDDPALEAQLVDHLGRALLAFVASVEPSGDPRCTHVVTKSPTVAGLDAIDRLWPGTRPVLLVRDARAVVASATRSFGGSPERWARVWREGARTILRCQAGPAAHQVLVVRYEDLLADLPAQMARVCAHVGLDPDRYDHDAARALAVRGSSESAHAPGGLHWQPREGDARFDPLRRREELPASVRDRVEWLAGAELRALGYEAAAVPPDLGQRCRDLGWSIARWGRRAIEAARPRST